jgi:hypothetical protein
MHGLLARGAAHLGLGLQAGAEGRPFRAAEDPAGVRCVQLGDDQRCHMSEPKRIHV